MPTLRFAALIAIFGVSVSAADQWLRPTTPHFELFTTAGEKKAREAIVYFEQVHSFFLQASPSKKAPDFPVRIIAFRGEKQYRPYRLNDFATAYYTGSHDRDYIVMQDIQSEHYPVAIHEYTHLIIRHAGLKIPIFMNEGWAELFSTLQPKGNKAVVGALIPGRLQTIRSSKWVPLQVLVAVDEKSPLYNERDKANVFYAESWLFMHMLFLGDRYRAHFSNFVQSVQAGKSFEETCRQVLGMSVAEVDKDLQGYLNSNRLFGAVFDVKLEKSAEQASISEVPQFDSDLALADLLALIHKPEEARAAYERLVKENRPEVEASLGYLAWQTGDTKAAREHFAKALAAGDHNPQMCYHYAGLSEHAGDRDQAIAALSRAVEIKPDYGEARLRLGSLLLVKQDYNGALAALRPITRVDEEQAERFFGALAFAYLRTDNRVEARKNAELAKKWAKTPAETEHAAEILSYLDNLEHSQAATVK